VRFMVVTSLKKSFCEELSSNAMNRCYAVTIAETLLVSVFRSRVQVAGLKRGSHGLGKDENRE
jgi:hypothetical protein